MADPGTLLEAQEMYAAHSAAVLIVLKNQSYTIKDRTYERADYAALLKGQKYWLERVIQLTAGGIKSTRALPRDR